MSFYQDELDSLFDSKGELIADPNELIRKSDLLSSGYVTPKNQHKATATENQEYFFNKKKKYHFQQNKKGLYVVSWHGGKMKNRSFKFKEGELFKYFDVFIK